MNHFAYSPTGLALTAAWKRARRSLSAIGAKTLRGECPLCGPATRFVVTSDNYRESPVCVRCGSVPRQRALVHFVRENLAALLDRVHESSPSLCSYTFFAGASRDYTASYCWPHGGAERVGCFLNVDLCAPPPRRDHFGLVVTQDVLEHLPAPEAALQSVQASLRRGGVHVFTVPRLPNEPTRRRATINAGSIQHHLPPEHHFDPVSRRGTLVFTDWGTDACEAWTTAGGAPCVVHGVVDPSRGIERPIEVFTQARR